MAPALRMTRSIKEKLNVFLQFVLTAKLMVFRWVAGSKCGCDFLVEEAAQVTWTGPEIRSALGFVVVGCLLTVALPHRVHLTIQAYRLMGDYLALPIGQDTTFILSSKQGYVARRHVCSRYCC